MKTLIYYFVINLWLFTAGCELEECILPETSVEPAPYVKVASGNHHSLAIDSDGQLWAWGNNASGQLGDSTTTNQDVPVHIGSGYIDITTGRDFSLAIHQDGTLWAWGKGYTAYPSRIDFGFVKVDAGDGHVLAIKKDNTLWSWGENVYGQLGDGTYIDHKYPVCIGSDFISIVASGTLSMAIKKDRTLWSWGRNTNEEACDTTIINMTCQVERSGDVNYVNQY